MEQSIKPLIFVLAVFVTLSAFLGASVLLPHDRYHRYQSHHDGTTRKADWIFERLNFDPTPIDVALIGTSRTGGGLSGPKIEQFYCQETGRQIHVTNLALPKTGRNMHYVIAKEALRTKAPKLLVLELNEVETRRPHQDFVYLADAKDVLSAPLWLNFNFFTDLLRLPGRQAELFAQDIAQTPTLRVKFDPDAYQGAHFDRTQNLIAIDGTVKSRNVIHSQDTMTAMRNNRQQGVSRTFLLPSGFEKLEYRLSRYYLGRIAALAERAEAQIAYLYTPAYKEDHVSNALLNALEIDEPVLNPARDLANDPTKWFDATHLNSNGALIATKRFAKTIATTHPSLGVKGCKFD